MKKLLLILSLVLAPAAVTLPLSAAANITAEIGKKASPMKATAVSGGINLELSESADSPMRFMVYSITGQMIKSIELQPGTDLTIELPAGYYIVKTSQWSQRLVVR